MSISSIRQKLQRVMASPHYASERAAVRPQRPGFSRPYSDQRIQRFEQEHGVSLPTSFRRFLGELGHGGPGPYYGILPMSDFASLLAPNAELVRKPSVLSPTMTDDPAWLDRVGVDAQERYRGAIAICHQGCTCYSLLVVAGPFYGRVVNIDLDDQPPRFAPDAGFAQWYERWLDELLCGMDVRRFGYTRGGSLPELTCRLGAAGKAAERAEAAVDLGRHPELDEAASLALKAAIEDEAPVVREAAIGALSAHHAPDLAQLAIKLLLDPSPSVRQVSAHTLRSCAGTDSLPALEAALAAESHDEVYFQLSLAYSALDGAQAAVFEAVLAHHPDPSFRKTAAYALGLLGDEPALTYLVPALQDEDSGVRLYAVQAIRDLPRTAEAVEALRKLAAVETDPTILRNLERIGR
ncbi:MAG: HEAT repeat domain-containing protein [Bradymonadales bacterium]|nr:HEAT repeat domain-containing protein [Bradymonadales bacterium]